MVKCSRGLVSSDQICFLALGVIAAPTGAGNARVRLREAHDGGRFCYHLARENYYPLPIATFLFASDIPSEGTTMDKGPSGLGKEPTL